MNGDKPKLLGYHGAECPHCKKQIFIPEYRQQPGTIKDLQRHSRMLLKSVDKSEAK